MTLDNDFHICKAASSPGASNSFKKGQAEATECDFDQVKGEVIWYPEGSIVGCLDGCHWSKNFWVGKVTQTT